MLIRVSGCTCSGKANADSVQSKTPALANRGLFEPFSSCYTRKNGFSVSICREWSLVKNDADQVVVKCLLCRSWNCEHCRPLRKQQLQALAFSGEPTRFLTLTVNPAEGKDADERRGMLAVAFNHLTKRIRRKYGRDSFEFLSVVEKTAAGEPHLHILCRGHYLPHKEISAWMAELINAPIVDIRSIRSAKQAVQYVTKYVSKAPEQFAAFKRYWASRGYELEKPDATSETVVSRRGWVVEHESPMTLLRRWQGRAFVIESWNPDGFWGHWRPGLSP